MEQLDLIITLSPILQLGPITTLAPIDTFFPINESFEIAAEGWIDGLSISKIWFLNKELAFAYAK